MNAADLLDVVGIGADGWRGLGDDARAALRDAEVLLGSTRQLALLPPDLPGRRVAWPSPLLPALQPLLEEHADRRVCVLASGDPMLHGIGATLARLVGAERLRVHVHPSSVSLACARLGWPAQDV
ncbi:MAG TPA: precorrin-6y C5,15-methyltransferase (decarboxylating) subunit CbiE, partial [Actinomycetales bacterium]|nr:precorrin-6y C5,15-methyltransferase (decarboxylating) subunit CbiE [Actinomycetales bacterium]